MKTILSIVAALSIVACGVSSSDPDVSPSEAQATSDLLSSTGASGSLVAASTVDPAFTDVASLHLDAEPRTCLMDPGGPVTCCSQTGDILCCFFFRTGMTRCTTLSGPPTQTP